jgi:excisionase family DNA binding protein
MSVKKGDKILTAPEIAKFFGVSKKTVYAWCKEGNIPAFKIGQEWMVRQSDLQKMINAKVTKRRDLFSK